MKKHIRLLYAVAVVALVSAGLALKADNDTIQKSLEANKVAIANHGSTP